VRRLWYLLFAVTAAYAGGLMPVLADRVVAPVRCYADNGVVRIEPSTVRMYPIAGGRSQRLQTICSPNDRNNCTILVAHSFSLDCGEVIVPWTEIAARLLQYSEVPVQLRRGQLSFQLREGSLRELNAICARTAGRADRGAVQDIAGRGLDHWQLDKSCRGSAYVPRMPIVMERGFAPLAEFGGRIIAEAGTAWRGPPPLPDRKDGLNRAHDAGPPRLTLASIGTGQDAPDVSGAPPRHPDSLAAPLAQNKSRSVPAPVVGNAAPGTQQVRVSRYAVPPARAIMENDGTGASSVPVTLNAWSTLVEVVRAGAGDGATAEARRTAQQSMIATMLGLALLTSLFSGVGWFAGRKLWRANIRKIDPTQVMLRREVVDLAKPDAQMCGELCRSAQGLVGHIHAGVTGLQGVAPLRRVLLREVRNMEQFLATTVSTAPETPPEWRKMRLRLQRVVTDLLWLKDITDGARRSLTSVVVSKGLPRDKQEAYEVLGANPEASEKILKRLVDALRATWHPDHAKGEEDRLAREDRIKQINVAWDLISEKRVEA